MSWLKRKLLKIGILLAIFVGASYLLDTYVRTEPQQEEKAFINGEHVARASTDGSILLPN